MRRYASCRRGTVDCRRSKSRLGPLCFAAVSRSSSASRHSMVLSGFRIGLRVGVESVLEHPLDLADPDRHARQFGGVGVDLDALDASGPTRGSSRCRPSLGIEIDAVLDVLERLAAPDRGNCRSRRPGRARGSSSGARGTPVKAPAPSLLALMRALAALACARLRQLRAICRLGCLPFARQRLDDHRVDDQHDLVGSV